MPKSLLVMLLISSSTTAVAQQTGGDEDWSDEDWEDLPVEAPSERTPTAQNQGSSAGDAGREEGAAGTETFGHFGAEVRLFPRSPQTSHQPKHVTSSLVFQPGHEFQLGEHLTLRAIGYLRIDQYDPKRTHADAREAMFQLHTNAVTTTFGIYKVFWGVTESRHLVDVINQSDFADSLDGEEKFGQLMVVVAVDAGTPGIVELYAMTWFRPALFPGPSGRPGIAFEILEPEYESNLDRWHPDIAVRWSAALGEFDWALSYFYGTSREPELVPVSTATAFALGQRYDLIHQAGLEAQWTVGPWLLKSEAIYRRGQGPQFLAFTGGVEVTLSGIFRTNTDLGFITEYSYDGRDNLTYNFYDQDAFGAVRLSFNDQQSTQLLAGALVDVRSGTTMGLLEASRRFGEAWKAILEASVMHARDDQDPLYWFRRDHYVQAEIQYHF